MSNKRILLLFAVLTLLTSALLTGTSSRAQEAAQTIKYGDTLTDALTDQKPLVSYTFSGSKNDVVLIQLLTIADKDGKLLSRPTITITDARNKSVADSSKGTIIFFSGSGDFVAAQLPSKGDYTLTVSKDKDNTSQGQFTLTLGKVELLKQGNTVQGTISSRAKGVRYPAVYAVNSTDDFGIQFTRGIDSKFYPTVIVHSVDNAGVPVPAVYMAGSRFVAGTLGVEGSKDLYLITVGDLENDIRGDREKEPEQTADFEIGLVTLATGGAGK